MLAKGLERKVDPFFKGQSNTLRHRDLKKEEKSSIRCELKGDEGIDWLVLFYALQNSNIVSFFLRMRFRQSLFKFFNTSLQFNQVPLLQFHQLKLLNNIFIGNYRFYKLLTFFHKRRFDKILILLNVFD